MRVDECCILLWHQACASVRLDPTQIVTSLNTALPLCAKAPRPVRCSHRPCKAGGMFEQPPLHVGFNSQNKHSISAAQCCPPTHTQLQPSTHARHAWSIPMPILQTGHEQLVSQTRTASAQRKSLAPRWKDPRRWAPHRGQTRPPPVADAPPPWGWQPGDTPRMPAHWRSSRTPPK